MLDDPGPTGARETHISRLFFTPDRVLKQLKPVATSFLSFVEREDRLQAVDDEYRLNRRISPEVYLGTADVVEEGQVVDRLVVMRRLPAARQLDHLLAASGASRPDPALDDHLRAAARRIATFHAAEPALSGADAAVSDLDAVRQRWHDNLTDLAAVSDTALSPTDHQRVSELVDTYLDGRGPLFAGRIAGGWVRDGHGDLRAEHVFCLDDGPSIIDCVAFRSDFRRGDVLNDVAFLAMDVERLIGPAAAERLLTAYAEFTGEHHPTTLAHHYIAYRAHVRAKIAAIRLAQGDRDAAGEVATYHRLALDHLEAGRVRLVLVGGGPGTGKSTVARRLADRLGAVWLRTDEVRKTQAAFKGPGADGAGPDEGRYRPETTAAVYRELLDEARTLLAWGESVVLDATWLEADRRADARMVAAAGSAVLTELRCELPLDLARRRVATRNEAGHDPSDATPELVDLLTARFDPWPEAATVNTERTPTEAIAVACRHVLCDDPAPRPLGAAGPGPDRQRSLP